MGGGEEGGAQLLAASQHLTGGADADDATTSSCLPEPPRRTEADARPSSSLPVLVFSLFSPSPLRLMTNPARPLSRPSASTSPFSTSLQHTGRTPDHSAFGQVHMTFQTGKLHGLHFKIPATPGATVHPSAFIRGDRLAVSPAPKVGLTWQTATWPKATSSGSLGCRESKYTEPASFKKACEKNVSTLDY